MKHYLQNQKKRGQISKDLLNKRKKVKLTSILYSLYSSSIYRKKTKSLSAIGEKVWYHNKGKTICQALQNNMAIRLVFREYFAKSLLHLLSKAFSNLSEYHREAKMLKRRMLRANKNHKSKKYELVLKTLFFSLHQSYQKTIRRCNIFGSVRLIVLRGTLRFWKRKAAFIQNFQHVALASLTNKARKIFQEWRKLVENSKAEKESLRLAQKLWSRNIKEKMLKVCGP